MPWAVRRRSDGKWLKRTASSRSFVDALEHASTWALKNNAKGALSHCNSSLFPEQSEVEIVETCLAETGIVEVVRIGEQKWKRKLKVVSKPQRQGFRVWDSPQGALDVE